MDSATETPNGIQKHFYSDWSLWALLISNLIVIAWALLEKGDIEEILWIYWFQSGFIGFFWFFKLLSLKQFSTKDFTINDQPVEPTRLTKISTAIFFLLLFGFFHSGHGFFLFCLLGDIETPQIETLRTYMLQNDILQILPIVVVLFIYQAFSFFYNRKWLLNSKPNIGKMLFFPFARIIPMHLTILFFGFITAESLTEKRPFILLLLGFFMLLKTLADVIMHVVERKNFSD